MALFGQQHSRSHNGQLRTTKRKPKANRAPKAAMPVVAMPFQLPWQYTKLQVYCYNDHAHLLPVAMRFLRHGLCNKGQPIVFYKCPCCGSKQGWAKHHDTGHPFRLFVNRR